MPKCSCYHLVRQAKSKRKNMKNHHTTIKRLRIFASATLLLVASAAQLLLPQAAFADQITNRSLTLKKDTANSKTSEGSAPGGGVAPNDGVVAHDFSFSMPGNGALTFQSIVFQYCTTAADVGAATCVTPTGLVTTNATIENQTGITGGTLVNTTNGSPYLTFASTQTPGTATPVTYRLGLITNPSTANETFFVRIQAMSASDGTGTIINQGVVAASTAYAIKLEGKMPESLVFCTGATVGLNGVSGLPDCSTASTGTIYFNQLFSPVSTAYAVSQMAASTNAGTGYAITINGPTLTSGGNTISAMASAAQSQKGVAQFGLNLVANDGTAFGNTAPNIAAYDNDNNGATASVGSANVSPASDGTGYRGQPSTTANYGTPGLFKFTTGDTVANSAYDGTTNTTLGPTDAQIYTVSYIANVPGSQAAGTYNTTLLYICTPTF